MRFLVLGFLAAAAYAGAIDDAKEKFSGGDFTGALAVADGIPEDDADYAKAQYLAGEIGLLLGDPAAAEKAFRAALAKKPGAEPILTGLGRALLERDQVAEASKILDLVASRKVEEGLGGVGAMGEVGG